jgi:hypothetical protein
MLMVKAGGVESLQGASLPLGRHRRAAVSALLGLAIAIGGAQSASAQLSNGASGSSTMSYISGEEALKEVVGFGDCYAKQSPEKALRLIATRPASREEALTYKSLFSKHYQVCLGDVTRLSADLTLIRGAIAEGLYKRKVPIPATLMQPAPSVAEVRNVSDAARCYVAAHADEARRVVSETKVGSRKEYDAVMKLMPDFFQCVPDGARVQITATLVRLRLTEALLRTVPTAVTAGSN